MIWPQLTLICLSIVGLVYVLTLHGQPQKEMKHDVFTTAIAKAITHGLLWWGGFYDELIRRLSGH